MLDLSQIFPANYPDIPSQQDIEAMFQDILNHSDSVNQVVCTIEEESCPYCKEALTHCLADKIDIWYLKRRPIAGYEHGNSWIPYWQEPKDKIRQLINRYQAEQKHFTYKPLQTSPVVPADCLDLSAIPLSKPSIPATTHATPDGSVPVDFPTGNQSPETSLQSLVQSLRKVITEVAAIRNDNTYQNITINMPVYVVQSGNVGTFVGDVGTFVGQAENINLK